nr:hypothetical protein GTC16762_31120 [Pigmentibacter ruber]
MRNKMLLKNLNFIFKILLIFKFTAFHLSYAQDAGVSGYITATTNLTSAIRSMSPVVFLLGLVFLLASAGLWIWIPKSRTITGWVWGSFAIIILIYFVGTFYSEPLRATFSAVLDPIKWVNPSGS